MYLNIPLYKSKNLQPEDLFYLCAIKQIDKEVLETLPNDVLERFKTLSLVEYIKGKKNEEDWCKLRLSKKGKELTNNLSFEGAVDEETEVLGDWLINLYKSKSGGIVKNKTEIKRRLQWFKTITQISGNRLATLLSCFIQDTFNEQDGLSVREFMEQNPRGVLSNMLDLVCWNPPNHFAKNYTLADSPLYTYFEDNQEYVEKVWESKNL